MASILSIESSGTICSAALHINGELIDILESSEQNIHAEMMAVFVRELMLRNSISYTQLSAVAISEGPGSYTGLRIGLSIAKGLSYAANLPLIAIDTLQSLAFEMRNQLNKEPSNAIFLPMIDARRMEVYLAGFNLKLEKVIDTKPVIIEKSFYDNLSVDFDYYLGGNGSNKIELDSSTKKLTRIHPVNFSAKQIGALAWQKFIKKDFVDVAYFEPVYLKEFAVLLKK